MGLLAAETDERLSASVGQMRAIFGTACRKLEREGEWRRRRLSEALEAKKKRWKNGPLGSGGEKWVERERESERGKAPDHRCVHESKSTHFRLFLRKRRKGGGIRRPPCSGL